MSIEVYGHEVLRKKLVAMVRNKRQAHALLFTGNEGSASTLLALWTAHYIMCEAPQAHSTCGACRQCLLNKKYSHPDLHFFFPYSSSQANKSSSERSECLILWRTFIQSFPYGGVMAWRQFLSEKKSSSEVAQKNLLISKENTRELLRQVFLSSYMAHCRIFFIWIPELMHVYAANALLKTLEDPPSLTYFILVSERPHTLLPTLRSRTQRICVPPFSLQEITSYLENHTIVSNQQATQYAHIASGNLHKALFLAEHKLSQTSDRLQAWLRSCYLYDVNSVLTLSEDFAKCTRFSQQLFLQEILEFLRQVLLYKNSLPLLMSDEYIKFLSNFSKTVSFVTLEVLVEVCNAMCNALDQQADAKMLFFANSLTIADSFRAARHAVL